MRLLARLDLRLPSLWEAKPGCEFFSRCSSRLRSPVSPDAPSKSQPAEHVHLSKLKSHWNGPRFRSKFHAFPSGHAASSTAFFVTLFLARKKIGAPLLLIPVLIGLSRMDRRRPLSVRRDFRRDSRGHFCAARCALAFNPQSAIRNPQLKVAEGVGFEPTRACALPVFKTGAINHSTTPPGF